MAAAAAANTVGYSAGLARYEFFVPGAAPTDDRFTQRALLSGAHYSLGRVPTGTAREVCSHVIEVSLGAWWLFGYVTCTYACTRQTLRSRLMGCLHGLHLALRWRGAEDPAVWSRAAPALLRAPAEAPAGWSRRGLRAVYAVRGGAISKHFEQLVARELLEGSR